MHGCRRSQPVAIWIFTVCLLAAAMAFAQTNENAAGSAYGRSGSVQFGPHSMTPADVPYPGLGGEVVIPTPARVRSQQQGPHTARDQLPQVYEPAIAPEQLAKAAAAGETPLVRLSPGRPLADMLSTNAMRADAQLHDVWFCDARTGWAVGDRGTICHTDDGGAHWLLQSSGMTCTLYSVCFVSPKIGWAAGGYSHPLLHTSTGVLLATEDGGVHWKHLTKVMLPLVKQVRFFNERNGWALTAASALFPSGVFLSDSGGQGWQPVAGTAPQAWLGSSFLSPGTGVLVGRLGSVAMVSGSALEVPSLPPALQGFQRVKLVPPQYGWLIGDGGTVSMTADLGRTWQPPLGGLPQEMKHFDLAAIAVRGPKCWIAGTPGTRVFHSPDAGRTWTAAPTGQALPLDALQFVDDQHGWAVGPLGTILATDDGGHAWRQQRGCGRAALLGLFSEPEGVPLELLARWSGNEGYTSVVEMVTRRDVEVADRAEVELPLRMHEAVLAVGGSAAVCDWRFPLRQAGLGMSAGQVRERWDAAQAGKAMEQLELHLVRQLRLWRPSVVVTEECGAGYDDAASQLLGPAVAQAVRQAGDASYQPERMAALGLTPWTVQKTYGALPAEARGPIELPTAQLAARLGRSLADVATPAAALLQERVVAAPAMRGFRLLDSRGGEEQQGGDFFAGMSLAPGTEGRRELLDAAGDGSELLTRVTQKRRNVQAIFDRLDRDPQRGMQWLAQTDNLLAGLDADDAPWLLFHLADRYHRAGKWELEAEVHRILLERYAEHPLTRAVWQWLVQYYASGEAAQRARQGVAQGVQLASTLSLDVSEPTQRAKRAVGLGNFLEQAQPALYAQPQVLFPLAAAMRRAGAAKDAERLMQSAARRPSGTAWRACGEAETWLATRHGPPPKPVLHAVIAETRPRLDGCLDDPLWQHVPATVLHSPHGEDTEWPAEVRVAYDKQFLYLALRCRQATEASYPPAPSGPRPRDANLARQDHVDILLDVDRDYATYYQLAVDHRGWTSDACWGDASWNPTWYVATRKADGFWTAELAIPLDQLTDQPPASGDAWACGIQRIVPGVGFQSCNLPAAATVLPEGFGLLIFD